MRAIRKRLGWIIVPLFFVTIWLVISGIETIDWVKVWFGMVVGITTLVLLFVEGGGKEEPSYVKRKDKGDRDETA